MTHSFLRTEWLTLLSDAAAARALAERARAAVVDQRDMRVITGRLEENYRQAVRAKRELYFFTLRSSCKTIDDTLGIFIERLRA